VSSVSIALSSLVLMLVLIYAGLHVAITLGLLSFVGVWLIRGDVQVAANLLAQAVSDAIASHVFGVVPLFVLTGFVVAQADVGKDAFEVANQVFRRVRGGLGVATVAANAVFAAITGISIASAAVFTRVAVPQMLRFGYRAPFAVGVVAGSSVLGMLIPPSLLMILYGFLSGQSVGDLFTAGILPGLLLAVAYAVLIVLMARFRPAMVFEAGGERRSAHDPPMPLMPLMPLAEMALKTVPVVLLIGTVLGGIYAGWFTATEAGAVGAALALAIALVRRRLTWRSFWSVLTETGHVTVAVSFLIICASIYTRMLAMSGTPQALVAWMAAAGLGVAAFLAIYVVLVLLLGTVIDSSSIMLIVLPLMLPVAEQLGLNLIWFGVITVVAVEIGLLTPPFGLSVFVVKGTLGDRVDITLGGIFRGTAPFTLTMLAVLVLLITFPSISLVLLK
jgi:C4-dicarboxylate transporter DctM subunit